MESTRFWAVGLCLMGCAGGAGGSAAPAEGVGVTATTTVTSSSTRRSSGGASSEGDGGAPAAAAIAPEVATRSAREAEAEALYQRAVDAAGRNEFPEAARLFGEAYERAPSFELAFNAFRMCQRAAMIDEGQRWSERALSHHPSAAQRVDLQQRMASLRDYDRRRHDNIARLPADADALEQEAATFFNRGVGLYQRRQYQPALAAFEAALHFAQRSQREVGELYFNLAVTHEHLGHRPEATAAFREYLSRRPDSPDRAAIEERIRALSR